MYICMYICMCICIHMGMLKTCVYVGMLKKEQGRNQAHMLPTSVVTSL